MNKLAPIIIFTYNRLQETKETVESLQANYLATESELFIFSDGAKSEKGQAKIDEVRNYIKTVNGFKSVIIKESPVNKGLANSIIDGVSEVLNTHEIAIVLEDDLVSSPNFLDFMNQALTFYKDSKDLISISGYSRDLTSLKNHTKDYYVGYRASSLGWGTWKNKWINIDWEVSDYSEFKKDYKKQYEFSKIGSDMPGMLKRQMEGEIDSWAIRWCYHQFRHNLKTVFATKSKINHIGYTEGATNALDAIQFDTPLDTTNNRQFEFSDDLSVNNKINNEFRSKFSVKTRIIRKLKRIFKKL